MVVTHIKILVEDLLMASPPVVLVEVEHIHITPKMMDLLPVRVTLQELLVVLVQVLVMVEVVVPVVLELLVGVTKEVMVVLE